MKQGGSSSLIWILLGVAAAAIAILGGGLGGILKFLLIAGGIILLLVAVAMFFALRNSSEEAKQKAANGEALSPEDAAILSQGRHDLTDLRMLGTKLQNMTLREKNTEICGIIEKILNTLKENPSQVSDTQMYLQYYLPTQKSILKRYVQVQGTAVEKTELTEKVLQHLADIQTASERQLTNLFEDSVLDMSAEMDMLSQSCREDGLL